MEKRITLRINTDELRSIDEFLAKHGIRNRSGFIRDAVDWFIHSKEEDRSKNYLYINLPYTRLTYELRRYVPYGYFDSIESLLSYVLNKIYESGVLQRILEDYADGVHSIRLSEYDRNP